MALVSDAGMPLVSDPGYVLVRSCVAAGVAVEVLPGPSAAMAALVASALPADRWRFAGFLPRKKGELRAVLSEPGGTLVAFESPRRVPATLALLAELDPDRPVGRLPRADQGPRGGGARHGRRAVRRGIAAEPPKGEVVLVIGPGHGRRTRRSRARGARPLGGWWMRARSRAPPPRWWPS